MLLDFLFEHGSEIIYFFIAILSLFFLRQYVWIAFKNNKELNKIIKQIKSKGEIEPSLRKEVFNKILGETTISHHWLEYQETLHDQFNIVDGEYKLDKTRATITAAAFFSQQNIIDSKINSEFYKHLPGVLTGLGIIGTFIGLLFGLSNFDIKDPTKIEQSVNLLLHAVEHAFYASATAIFVAMLVTLIEKLLLNKAIVLLDEVVQLIDKQFIAGIGEEYLSDLVKNSQENAVQTKQLKDSLVNDLKTMLENLIYEQSKQSNSLAEKLIESNKTSAELTAKQISESVESVFREPLQKIADTVHMTSQDQSSQVQSLLADVLTEFHQKLEENFGRQFKGLGEMLEKSTDSIASMQNGFVDLIEELKSASRDTGQEMNTQMSNLLLQIEQRQATMADKFNDFINTTQANLERSSNNAINSVTESISTLDQRFQSVFNAFNEAQDEIGKKSLDTQNKIHEQTLSIIDGVNGKVERLVETINEQQSASKETINLLQQNTEQTLVKINESVLNIEKASQQFINATQSLANASNDFENMLDSIASSSNEFANTSQQVSRLISDYGNHRAHLESIIQKFNAIHESLSAEAETREHISKNIEALNNGISSSVDEMKNFMNQYESLMSSSFQIFGDGVSSSLNKVLQDLDKGLAVVVNELKANFDELSESIEDLAEAASNSARK